MAADDGNAFSACAVTAFIALCTAASRASAVDAEAMATAVPCNSCEDGSMAATRAASAALTAALFAAAAASSRITRRDASSVASAEAVY